MDPIDRPPRRLGTPLLLALALGGFATGAKAEDQGDKCNPNLFAPPGAGEPWLPAARPDFVSGKPLKPGQTRRTRGTDTILSPELVGITVYDQTLPFSFTALAGVGATTIAGTYEETIVASNTDGTCKQQASLTMSSGCISKVVFHDYLHPKRIVADYRRDLPGDVQSDFASRSGGSGLTFEFHLKQPVCAPHTTRFLLLNTSIKRMTILNALELVTPEGIGSPPFAIHVPDAP